MTARTPEVMALRLRDVSLFGTTRGQLRGLGWERLSQGLHAKVSDKLSTAGRLQRLAGVLPRESGFGHLTSAAMRNWWMPNRLPAHVVFGSTRSGIHVQRRGLYVRRSRFAEIEMIDGVPLMTAPETLIELARDLSLIDLVPMVDRALAAGTTPAEIRAAARPGARGSRVLRSALALADPKSESWWESVLRMQHTLTGLGPVSAARLERYRKAADHPVASSGWANRTGSSQNTPLGAA